MIIRCRCRVLHQGDLYLRRGDTATVSAALAAPLLAAGHVEEVKPATPPNSKIKNSKS